MNYKREIIIQDFTNIIIIKIDMNIEYSFYLIKIKKTLNFNIKCNVFNINIYVIFRENALRLKYTRINRKIYNEI